MSDSRKDAGKGAEGYDASTYSGYDAAAYYNQGSYGDYSAYGSQ